VHHFKLRDINESQPNLSGIDNEDLYKLWFSTNTNTNKANFPNNNTKINEINKIKSVSKIRIQMNIVDQKWGNLKGEVRIKLCNHKTEKHIQTICRATHKIE